MSYSEKKYNQQRKLLIIVCWVLVAVLLFLICVLFALSRENTFPTNPTGTNVQNPSQDNNFMKDILILNSMEQGNRVVITTNYCTMSYSQAFSDIVIVRTQMETDCAMLHFLTNLDGEEVPLYTLRFANQEEWPDSPMIPVGILQTEDALYKVAVHFYGDENVSHEDKSTFVAAQETINDVIPSLLMNEGFTEVG